MEEFIYIKIMQKNVNVTAVILSAGKGKRMGNNFKQFIKIYNKPVLFYSLEKLIRCDFIKTIIVAAPKEKYNYALKIIHREFNDKRIKLVIGGNSRRISSHNALAYINDNEKDTDYVIFHDAARPLISIEMIKTILQEGKNWGAAVMGVKALDTVSIVEKSFVVDSLNVDNEIYYTHTPHCYKFDWIWKAHNHKKNKHRLLKDAENATLLVNIGKKVKMIRGFYPNLKLTYWPDIKSIKAFLR